MALTVTHFPGKKLTFAILFGCTREQERNIIARLKKADEDAAHPMLLPGILAELERIRQMAAVEGMIDELETQIYQLDNETVTSWNHSDSTKAERNRQKTKAWLDTTFARNLLLGHKSLLLKMRKHIEEFPLLVRHHPIQKYGMTFQETSSREQYLSRSFYPNGPFSPSRSRSSSTLHYSGPQHGHNDTGYLTDAETITEEPETIHDAGKYQECIHKAGVRMQDRLGTMMEEYDDKIRDCTMRVDGMAMATQWVCFSKPRIAQGRNAKHITTSLTEKQTWKLQRRAARTQVKCGQ